MKTTTWKLLAATTCLCGFGVAANAADLAVRPMPPAVAVAEAFSWTGLYIGAHVGGGVGRYQSSVPYNLAFGAPGTGTFPSGYTFGRTTLEGGFAGGQVGGNLQFGALVIGAEADFSGARIDGSSTSRAPGVFFGSTGAPGFREATTETRINSITLATGRIGFAWGNALIYAKGGGAWADFETLSNTNFQAFGTTGGNGLVAVTRGSKVRDGYTIGGGVEYAFNRNWSVKLEYNYVDFRSALENREQLSGGVCPGAPSCFYHRNARSELHLAKAGVNYRFDFWNPAPGPVVARY